MCRRVPVISVALAVTIAVALPGGAVGQSLEILASRNTHVTALYMRLSYTGVVPAFGSGLLPEDDRTTALTFSQAQALLAARTEALAASLQMSADSQPVPIADVDALLHWTGQPIRFETPLDGSLATAICATPDRPLAPPSEFVLHAAFTAEVPLTTRRLSVAFPAAVQPLDIALRLFERGQLVEERTVTLAPGEPLDLSTQRHGGSPAPPLLVVMLVAASLVVGAAVAGAWRRVRRSARRHRAVG